MCEQRGLRQGPEGAVEIPEELLLHWQHIVDLLAEVIGVPAALVMRAMPPEIGVLVASHTEGNPYEPDERAQLDTGLYCERVMATRQMLLVPDALASEEWRSNPDVTVGMISYLGLPLLLPDGAPFGTICVLDRRENTFGDVAQRLLGQFREVVEADLKHLAVMTERLNEERRLVAEISKARAELQGALEQLDKSYWHLRKIQEVLPICMRCGKVKTGDADWEDVVDYLKKNSLFLSHGYCPACAGLVVSEVARNLTGS